MKSSANFINYNKNNEINSREEIMPYLPKARAENIIVQELGKETLIYDLRRNQAFSLNETSTMVYQACDGRTTFEEFNLKNKFPREMIFLALDELGKKDLLDETHSYYSPLSGMNRRAAVRKVGLASMVALPVITSIVAPTAAMSQSGCLTQGQTAGSAITGLVPCGSSSETLKNTACTLRSGLCCFNQASYAGDCSNDGAGGSTWTCVCGTGQSGNNCISSGQPVGSTIIGLVPCGNSSTSLKNSACTPNAGLCCTNQASYAGDCADNGSGGSNWTCVCG
jgi:hypothetical protein